MVKSFIEVQDKGVNLSTFVLDFSPVINYRNYLSFTTVPLQVVYSVSVTCQIWQLGSLMYKKENNYYVTVLGQMKSAISE